MAGVVVDIILGTLIPELYKGIKKLISKSMQFEPLLKSIKPTLGALKPVIEQIQEFNTELDLSNQEIESCKKTISKGISLIKKLSKVERWDCMKPGYTDQLQELDESLRRHLVMLKAQGLRDVKETLVLARKMQMMLNQIYDSWVVTVFIVILACIFCNC